MPVPDSPEPADRPRPPDAPRRASRWDVPIPPPAPLADQPPSSSPRPASAGPSASAPRPSASTTRKVSTQSDFYPSWSDVKVGRLHPGQIIAEGTQVLTIVDKPIPGSGAIRRSGSRGKVERAPVDNAYAYLIAFADGAKMFFKQRELALAGGQEDEDELADQETDFSPFVIYAAGVGLRTAGLGPALTPDVQDDIRGAYLPPASNHWSLWKVPEQIQRISGNVDEVYHELESFLRMGLKGHPFVIEALWSPRVVTATAEGKELRDLGHAFLSRRIGRSYSTFVLDQFRKMEKAWDDAEKLDRRRACELLRLLHSAIHTLTAGTPPSDAGPALAELTEVLQGGWSYSRLRDRAWALERELKRAAEVTTLPDAGNASTVSAFLVAARQRRATEKR